MASAEAAERLGPLIRNQTTNMGLDNTPKRCGCKKHPRGHRLPDDGTVHPETYSCLFQDDPFPRAVIGTCCSIRGKVAFYNLLAFGEEDLGHRMYKDMTCGQALSFAAKLRAVVGRLETSYAGRLQAPGQLRRWDREAKKWEPYDFSTAEEALVAFREAASWFDKVGSLGYGVHAWG